MDSVAGIDLSGVTRSSKSRTALAEIVLGDRLTLRDRFVVPAGAAGDRFIVEWAAARRPRTVAIDAPLTLPHSLTCSAPSCERCAPGSAQYLERDVDRLARAEGGGMPFVMLAAIAFRGIYLARQLREIGCEVVETYPGAAYRRWGLVDLDPVTRASAVQRRIGSFDWTVVDEIDAIAAAVAAADHGAGARAALITAEDGTIVLPSL